MAKAGGLLAIGPQHGEDPLHNQPDGVEEEAGDQGEDHLEGYFPRYQGQYNNIVYYYNIIIYYSYVK